MTMTDPVADYLTRIRNAHMASKHWVDIPSSMMKIRISYVLKEEKFIRDYILIKDDKQNILRIYLKYDYNDSPVIHGIKRISKPGCRGYVTSDTLPRVLNGLGIAIISTSKGVMTDIDARKQKVGGEIICKVF